MLFSKEGALYTLAKTNYFLGEVQHSISYQAYNTPLLKLLSALPLTFFSSTTSEKAAKIHKFKCPLKNVPLSNTIIFPVLSFRLTSSYELEIKLPWLTIHLSYYNIPNTQGEQKRVLLYSVFRTRIPLWLNPHMGSECTITRSKIIMKKLQSSFSFHNLPQTGELI